MNATSHLSNLLTLGFNVLGDQVQGDPTVCIAILDGPVDSTHPCFDGADLSDIEEVSPCALRSGRAGELMQVRNLRHLQAFPRERRDDVA